LSALGEGFGGEAGGRFGRDGRFHGGLRSRRPSQRSRCVAVGAQFDGSSELK
jgi:hypothetical protein